MNRNCKKRAFLSTLFCIGCIMYVCGAVMNNTKIMLYVAYTMLAIGGFLIIWSIDNSGVKSSVNAEVKFAKLRSDVIIPSKRIDDAGYDIYPYFNEDYKIIKPHETIMINTGLSSIFNCNIVGILKERGSTGMKGIGQRSGVIDSSFRGEWKIPITNHNKKHIIIIKDDCNVDEVLKKEKIKSDVILYPYSKAISQVVFLRLANTDVSEIGFKIVESAKTSRGKGMLGSSGK